MTNVFEPPQSKFELEDADSKVGRSFAVACFLGVLYGVLLWVPALSIPFEWVAPLLAPIKAARAHLPPDIGYNLALAFLLFLVSIPKTLLIALLSAYTIRFTGKMRTILYSSLCWPVLLFVFHWISLTSKASIAASRGVDPGLIHSVESADFAPKAILAFLIYALYLLLVFLLSRVIVKKVRNDQRTIIHGQTV